MYKSLKDVDFDRCVEGYEDMTISDLQMMPRSKKEAEEDGFDLYFTGFCNRGHLAVRSVSTGRCIKCMYNDGRKYYEANKENIIDKTVKYLNNRYKTDDSFKAKRIIRAQVHRLVSSSKLNKTNNTEKVVGYTSEEFKADMESKFLDGMCWSNYGTVWEIDHTIPVAMFDVVSLEDIKLVNALENLMPMFKDEHKSKTKLDMVRIIESKQKNISLPS